MMAWYVGRFWDVLEAFLDSIRALRAREGKEAQDQEAAGWPYRV